MKIVSSVDDLLNLPRDRRVNGMGPREPLQLNIPNLRRCDQIHAQSRLNRLQSRCGCMVGALALLASLVAGALHIYASGDATLSWRFAWLSLVTLFGAFVIGFVAKMLTLAVTRWQFARECRTQYLALSGQSRSRSQT
jgi:hypothetical protein